VSIDERKPEMSVDARSHVINISGFGHACNRWSSQAIGLFHFPHVRYLPQHPYSSRDPFTRCPHRITATNAWHKTASSTTRLKAISSTYTTLSSSRTLRSSSAISCAISSVLSSAGSGSNAQGAPHSTPAAYLRSSRPVTCRSITGVGTRHTAVPCRPEARMRPILAEARTPHISRCAHFPSEWTPNLRPDLWRFWRSSALRENIGKGNGCGP